MKVLFGIQGTGNGHLSRCHTIAKALRTISHHQLQVDYLISGRQRSDLFNTEVFGDFICQPGLSFSVSDGRLKLGKTLRGNALRRFVRDVKELPVKKYDLVLSDFEPISAWAARRAGKRCIGIGRQYAFKDPMLYRQLSYWQRLLINYFAPASEWLGMHWSPLADCFPPVIREHAPTPTAAGHILVYLPFEDLYRVVDALLPHTDYTFSLFHPQIKQTKYFASDHIMGFAPSRTTFAEQLNIASGVLANAGFETTCEALSQGKHLAVKAVRGQFEQWWNAHLLATEQRAHVIDHIDEQTIGLWLMQLAAGRQPSRVSWGDVSTGIANWLAQGAQQDTRQLRKTLWNGSPGWIRTNDTWINSPPL